MKRFFAAVLLGLCVAGCSKIVPEQQGGSVPISVVPAVTSVKSQGTKALVNSAEDLSAYPISLIGSFTRNSTDTEVFGNAQLSWSSGVWGYSGGTQYWIPGSLYKFAAFAPYAVTSGAAPQNSLSNGTVSYNGSTFTLQIADYNTGKTNSYDARSEDLLYASVRRDNTLSDDYSPVALNMQHLLACLEFSVRNATNTAITKVSGISLTGLKYKCTLQVCNDFNVIMHDNTVVGASEDYFAGADRTSEGSSPFMPAGMSVDSYVHLYDSDYLTVLPQGVYGNDIILKFTVHFGDADVVGTTYSPNLGSLDSVVEWEAGKKYRYNLTISSQDINFQVVEVPWVEHKVELK